jgi:phosphatidylserine/phosphatidylglycerophosphate/cardiolipin synthase-like enzyme
MDYTRKLWGEMGELKVSTRVSGLVARGLKVEELGRFLGRGPVADAARARLAALSPQFPQHLGKELDLILDQGLTWGEVKNYSEVLSQDHRFYQKVMEQARHTVQIRELLESDPEIGAALKALGHRIQFRIYLLGGVTDSVARELEALGFEVLGPRYLDAAGAALSVVAAGEPLRAA